MTRRIVTGVDADGRPVILEDGPPSAPSYQHTPGFACEVVWTSTSPPAVRQVAEATSPKSFVPGPGESVALTVTFPPDSVYGTADFDWPAAIAENMANTPGLAEAFEPDAPGFHATPTVDYAVVLDGSLVLDLGDGCTTELHAGDIVVQNATRHAWRVPSHRPATIFVVLLGLAR